MNVTCPECETTYRVDPRKVPAEGVLAQCARCPATFQVASTHPSPVPAAETDAGLSLSGGLPTLSPSPSDDTGWTSGSATDHQDLPETLTPATSPSPVGEPTSAESAPDAAARMETEPTSGSIDAEGRIPYLQDAGRFAQPALEEGPPVSPPGGSEGAPLPPPPFGTSDPHQRAIRLARALVSDIVVYHPDRRTRSLRQGTLRQEFREEIRKSWDEYSTQVGPDFARQTSYFKDALNEILANGSPVF